MGIRINKHMGYGLRLHSMGDARVNWDVLDEELLDELTVKKFRKRIDRWRETYRWKYQNIWYIPKGVNFYECVTVFDEESSLDDLYLMVRPPDFLQSTHRRDDSIDYTEYFLDRPRGVEPTGEVRPLEFPPYPYDNMLVRSDSLAPVANKYALRRAEGRPDAWIPDSMVLEGTGFSSLEELTEGTRLLPPAAVTLAAVGLRLFKDIETAYQLKPMLITSWS